MGLIVTSMFDPALSGLNFSYASFSAGLRPALNDCALSGLVAGVIEGIFVVIFFLIEACNSIAQY